MKNHAVNGEKRTEVWEVTTGQHVPKKARGGKAGRNGNEKVQIKETHANRKGRKGHRRLGEGKLKFSRGNGHTRTKVNLYWRDNEDQRGGDTTYGGEPLREKRNLKEGDITNTQLRQKKKQ